MLALLTRFRVWVWPAVLAVGAAMLAGLKYLSWQRARAEERAQTAETVIKRQKDMGRAREAIASDTDSRTTDLAKKIERGEPIDLTRWPDEN